MLEKVDQSIEGVQWKVPVLMRVTMVYSENVRNTMRVSKAYYG